MFKNGIFLLQFEVIPSRERTGESVSLLNWLAKPLPHHLSLIYQFSFSGHGRNGLQLFLVTAIKAIEESQWLDGIDLEA